MTRLCDTHGPSQPLHPYIVGQPHRLRHLRRALGHIAFHRERIWFTHAGAIARHAIAQPAGVVP